jgi:aldehyde:ferredoxin oxidoreductase
MIVTFKRTGFDHIVIEGVSPSPSFLVIGDGEVCRFEDASELWGQNTMDDIAEKLGRNINLVDTDDQEYLSIHTGHFPLH